MLDALTLLPSSVPFFLTLYNETAWPRAEELADVDATVSVLVPARNEEANIERCVRAALAVEPPVLEVVVCDDGSTDATPELLARLAAEDPRLVVLRGRALPEGWVGKPHACHQLGEAARGDVLLFVDADTVLSPTATARLFGLLKRYRAKVITAFPGQELGTFAERLVLPLLPLTFTSWMPLDLVWKHVDPRLLMVNGQFLAFRREAYAAIGGFASVKGDIVDDMAICRRAKEEDQRVVFVDGRALATTRMYRSGRELWEGFSKNLFEGMGASLAVLVLSMSTYLLAFVLPWARLGVELAQGAPSAAAVVGVGFGLGARGLLARRLGHALWSVLLNPVAVLVLVGIAVNSAVWSRTGRIRWRGRTYATGRTR